MRFDVLTVFPAVFPGPLGIGVVGRALDSGSVEVHVHDLREHTTDRHRQVDDMQFGGVGGMVLKPEPIVRAVRALRAEVAGLRTILLSPQGRVFNQDVAHELSRESAVLLVCGRYQGVDERARDEIGEELSVGDYVLSGGEVGAMAVIEATARLVPGVVGSPESLDQETFSSTVGGGLEPPLYTRPAEFEGHEVPAVLRNGDHAAITAWRRQQSEQSTRRRRPDLVRLRAVPGGNK
ncbi:MAG: tRNA (guanosine(37)-N1)-methyltransferase TrmD [Candidatus Dormibacteraeota bacterium]|uniref:tRNA (guanine-N(1)-)-methyltransferase n=1 Tax=Candidatus Aeolococcus gillhamiae TaxID=3127015 RepID=A0A934JYH1_9BACT|nr:tRNA (guanosine(37)-N1)-methyltransferase TrmD [Candidatus Dormibacteraeota bacterium]